MRTTKLVMHRNHDANSGGGSAPTVAELMKMNVDSADDEAVDLGGNDGSGNSGGDAGKSPEELAAEQQAAADAAAAEEAANKAAGAGENKGGSDTSGAGVEDEEEEKLTDEEKLALEENALAFVAELETVLGEELALEDDFIPKDLTPTEIAKLVQGVTAKSALNGAEQLEMYIKENFTPAYEYMLHLQSGGDPAEFWGTKPQEVHTADQVSGDVELQKQYLQSKFRAKGLDDVALTALIKTIETDGLLKEQALIARSEAETAAANFTASLEAKAEAAKTKVKELQTNLINTASSILKEGKLGMFQVPQEDRAGFVEAFSNSIEVTPDGKMFLKTEITDQTINEVLQKEYLAFKKGDLSKVIEVKAKTAATTTLRARINKHKTSPGGGSGAGAGAGSGADKKTGTLGDMFNTLKTSDDE